MGVDGTGSGGGGGKTATPPAAAAADPAPCPPSLEAVQDFLGEFLQSWIVVKNKTFVLRTSIPEGLSTNAYFVDAPEVVPLPQLPQHIRTIREERGQARALTPANRELFDFLTAHDIRGERVDAEGNKVPESSRSVIVPASFVVDIVRASVKQKAKRMTIEDKPLDVIRATPMSQRSLADVARMPEFAVLTDKKAYPLVIVGGVRRSLRDMPAYIITLAEASLKSKMHLSQMALALVRRIEHVIGRENLDKWLIFRPGDNAIHITYSKDNTGCDSAVEAREKFPIDLKTLALIPGIARIYDPHTVPQRVLDAEAVVKRIEETRAARVAQGLPPDPEYDPTTGEPPVLDGQGRVVRFPAQLEYNTNHKIVEAEQKRRSHRTVWGDVVAEGACGLPIQLTMRALCLMSGGIDSPVAAYNMMTRGCRVDFVHFLNSTSDTGAILTKLNLIARRLSKIQGRLDLRIVDISELQSAIIGAVSRMDRTVVYKQYMLLIAAAVPHYEMLVTGDSVAQVASQTAHNISTLYPNTPRAVVSPLSGANKNDIMDTSRRLGVFELSAMEGADCCQYLMCKTGANLCIGRGRMRSYLAKIQGIDSLPVKVMVFENGVEVPSANYTETIPFSTVKANLPTTVGQPLQDLDDALSTRREHRMAYRQRKAAAAAQHGDPAAALPQEEDSVPSQDATPAGSPTTQQPSAASLAAAVAAAAQAASKPREVYLDSAAATIIDPAVVDAMARAPVGNPNSLHTIGRVCRAAVEGVRHQLLAFLTPSLGAPFKVAFTSGGTEANNIGIRGLLSLLRAPAVGEHTDKRTAVFYPAIAHPSVVEVCKHAAATGLVDEAITIPLRTDGHIDLARLEGLLKEYTAFRNSGLETVDGKPTPPTTDGRPWSNVLLVMDLVNHELGLHRPSNAVVRLARSHGALIHVDACQALCKVDVDIAEFDSASVTAHKINGPVGVGALALRSGYAPHMTHVMEGGSFDGDVRPGTLNAPGVVGFGAALSLPRDEQQAHEAFDALVEGLTSGPLADAVRINGTPTQSSHRIVHLTLTKPSGAIAKMDDAEIVGYFASRHNIMLSTGAACSQHKRGAESSASKLYGALGITAGPSLRVSLEHTTTTTHITKFLHALAGLFESA